MFKNLLDDPLLDPNLKDKILLIYLAIHKKHEKDVDDLQCKRSLVLDYLSFAHYPRLLLEKLGENSHDEKGSKYFYF